ncbi:MAG: hypothetical protein Q9227_003620 [Pyrenula ochraceoflavens]
MTGVILGPNCLSTLRSILAPSNTFFRIGKWATAESSACQTRCLQKRGINTSTIKRVRPNYPSLRPAQRQRTRRCLGNEPSSPYSSSSRIPNPPPKLSFRLAAASCGKGRKFSRHENTYPFDPSAADPLGLEYGFHLSERRLDRRNSGEDAFFVSKISRDPDRIAFGIADGVGGWRDSGVNPADFSHGLCSQMALAATRWPEDFANLAPGKLMHYGYAAVLHDENIGAGGSTACVGCVSADGRLQIANLGDSGYLLLRTGRVHHYSNPQTHAFNTPYQLSVVPPQILARASVFGGLPYLDTPSKADVSENTLQEGDVLILATDGVWDNLNSQDLLQIVKHGMSESGGWEQNAHRGIEVTEGLKSLTEPATPEADLKGTLQSALAASIVSAARNASLDQKRDGPFAKEIQKHYPQDGWRGGKVDDICVVVLVAVNYDWPTNETRPYTPGQDPGEMEVDQMVVDDDTRPK